MGNRPVPTALKRITGNPGRRPLNDKEPTSPLLTATPPEWITGTALDFWKELVKVLIPMGHLTEADQSNVVALAFALAQLKEAYLGIQTDGYVIETEYGPKASPYVGVMDKAQKQVKSLLCELGMTPASRTKVVSLTGTKKDDPLNEFLDGGNEEGSEETDESGESLH